MSILRTLALAAFCIMATNVLNAQDPEITIYGTHDDFVAQKGRDLQRYAGYKHGAGKVTLLIDHNGEREKVKCADIWGFRYKDALFRVDHRYEQPAKLIFAGRLLYYENGVAHLSMMRDNKSTGDFSIGAYCYVSADLKDPLYQYSGMKKDGNKARESIEKIDPLTRHYFDCVGHTNDVSVHRDCMEKFMGEHPVEK